MRDSQKTRKQLLNELREARQQLEVLAAAEVERKLTGVELRQSEEKFYKAFLSSPDMVIITSIPEGKYVEVNESFASITGYSREELMGHTVNEFNLFVNPEEQQRMTHILQEQGNFKNEEYGFRTKSGEIRRWLCSAEIINLDGQTCMIAVASDITEMKKMEQALNESEQKLAMAFRSSPQAIAVTTLKDGRFIEVNESHCRLTGFTREEIIGHSAYELKIWAKPDERKKIIQELKKKGRFYNREQEFRSKSGDVRIVLFSAEIISIGGEECIISSVTDITDWKMMEDALRDSEEKFSKVFRGSPEIIAVSRLKDFTYIDVNDTFIKTTGYTREELIGHRVDEINMWVNPEEQQEMARLVEEQGNIKNKEYSFRMKSGEIRRWLCSSDTINIGGEPCSIASATDITELKRIEEALANEAVWRRVLIQHSKDGIVILNRNGKVYEANERFTNMLGYTPEEISQLHVWDWDTQWTRKELLDQLKDISEAGDHFETYHRRKDGTIFDVEISTNGATFAGKKLVFCVCRDVTERKRIEEALRLSEEKFSKAFRASPEVITITTMTDGRYLEVNESFTRVFGFSREEAIGRKSSELGVWVEPGDRDRMTRLLKKNGRLRNEDFHFYTKSGEIRSMLFSAELIECEGELCVLAVTNDITDYRRIEEQALEAESLREVNRLRTELLANVSHELRTPLASIKGFATMLMDYETRLKPREKREYLNTIDKNADRLVELIEQLLEMSRLGAGMLFIRKTPTNVAGLCQTVITEARVRALDYKFALKLPRKLPQIEIDDRRIRQVLDNIINNAVKYSDPETEIVLSVRKNGDDLLFTVTDHGIGIPVNDLPHIFDRMFHTTKSQKSGVPGAGLGLSICKGLVEAHGGKIWFDSKEGVGTSCFFTLPLNKKTEASHEERPKE